ncbi:uncharacterized protein LOC115376211 [Myripristis murdjan]|uniref:uncharacterized protein LOC115376211 n=1 Tax=Myripristis murdjan TaxID=586833 RepID=UPI001175F252|nr:uncharacterized protein LOC115376211 [Myripristis murdjan]
MPRRMNFILLTASIITLALTQEWQEVVMHGNNVRSDFVPPRKGPCEMKNNESAYREFSRKHLLTESFDTKSKPAWKKYLTKKGLCKRTEVQSFLNSRDCRKVKGICNGHGTRKQIPYNLNENICISDTKMTVYDVKVNMSSKLCTVIKAEQRKGYVMVACDEVGNRCRPVHYQRYNGETPDPKAQRCNPAVSQNPSFFQVWHIITLICILTTETC